MTPTIDIQAVRNKINRFKTLNSFEYDDGDWLEVCDIAKELLNALETANEREKERRSDFARVEAQFAALVTAVGEALEQAVGGVCAYCVHDGESMTDADSPCFESGMKCQSPGYYPGCEHWEYQ